MKQRFNWGRGGPPGLPLATPLFKNTFNARVRAQEEAQSHRTRILRSRVSRYITALLTTCVAC